MFESATSGGKGYSLIHLSIYLPWQIPAAVLDLLLECRGLQASVLHKYNRDLARSNDLIAQIYASQGIVHVYNRV